MLGRPDSAQFPPRRELRRRDQPLLRGHGRLQRRRQTRPGRRNWGSNTVSVLLGNGDGTFQSPVNYPVHGNPQRLVVGDFNGDGKLDLATANYYGGDVGILLGNGDGTFQPARYYGAGPSPVAIAAGDFNGDGNLDLVTAQLGSSTVSVLLGNGDGTFQSARQWASNGPTSSLAVGDFYNDGKLDIVVSNYFGANQFSLLRGNGDGTFQAPVAHPAGPGAGLAAVGDLNGDGNLDVVVADGDAGTIEVFLGNGDGTFRAPARYATGAFPYLATIADFNRDGHPDIAVANYTGSTVSILLGNGDGTFQDALNYAVGAGADSVAAGDFNGDGFPDLAVANFYALTVSVLLNDGHWPQQVGAFAVAGFPSPTQAGDADTFTVTALDAAGNVATGYTGTVHFTSTDPQAILPRDYTFTAADQGAHVFGAVLLTVGTQALTATDTADPAVTGSQDGIQVEAASASVFIVAGYPSPTRSGDVNTFTVTALDRFGNVVTGYRGSVEWHCHLTPPQLTW
jgi:hypothetical protein